MTDASRVAVWVAVEFTKRVVVQRVSGLDLPLQPQRARPPDPGEREPDPLVKRLAGGDTAVPFPVGP